MLESWVLVAWLVTDPTTRVTLGTFNTQAECESRVMWLDEPLRKKNFRRTFICVEVPANNCPVGTPATP